MLLSREGKQNLYVEGTCYTMDYRGLDLCTLLLKDEIQLETPAKIHIMESESSNLFSVL